MTSTSADLWREDRSVNADRIDISLVLNLHREATFLPRTLQSLREAAAYADAHGLIVELVVVLDRPDAATVSTLAGLDLSIFRCCQQVSVDHGSLGLARNAGCRIARGRYIQLCDGDDLISYNLLVSCFFTAEREGDRAIVVAEWLIAFGDDYHVARYEDLDAINPLIFVDVHPYVSMTFFHRSLFDVLQFADLRLTRGYAYEDWHFNCEALALGYKFFVGRDALRFYRVRQGGLLKSANAVSVRHIPPSRLFKPDVMRRVLEDGYRRALEKVVWPRLVRCEFLDRAVAHHLIAAANHIEPEIDPALIRGGSEYIPWSYSNLAIGRRYYELCGEISEGPFTDVFFLPFFGQGGAERYFLNIIRGVCELRPQARILVILGEKRACHEWLELLPETVARLDVGRFFDELGEAGINLITLKIIQSVAEHATLHLRTSLCGHSFFEAYGRALPNRRIYHRFSQEVRREGDLEFFLSFTTRFLSAYASNFDIVVSDNQTILDADRRRLGSQATKWHLLPSLCEPSAPASSVCARSISAGARILWASRLSWEKRPELLITIAEELRRLAVPVIIDVFGVESRDYPGSMFEGLENLVYRGPFSNLPQVVGVDHFAFIYTSLFDGVPNVLLEVAGCGLPIIAPDVGGVGEFVEHGVTGLLLRVPEEQLVVAYVEAIQRLLSEPGLRQVLAGGAYERLVRRHSRGAFLDSLAPIVGRSSPSAMQSPQYVR